MGGQDRPPERERRRQMPGRAPQAQARQAAAGRQGEPFDRDAADPFAAGAVEGEDGHLGAGRGEALGDLARRRREAARRRRIVPGQKRGAHQAASRRR